MRRNCTLLAGTLMIALALLPIHSHSAYDIPTEAATLSPTGSASGTMIETAPGVYDSYDWYRITTPADGRLTIISQTTGGNLDLQLYIYRSVADMLHPNPSGNYVGGGGGTDLNSTVILDAAAAGTYYLQIIRRSGTGSYALACGSGELTSLRTETPVVMPQNQGPLFPRTPNTLCIHSPSLTPGTMEFFIYSLQGRLVASGKKIIAAKGLGTVAIPVQGKHYSPGYSPPSALACSLLFNLSTTQEVYYESPYPLLLNVQPHF